MSIWEDYYKKTMNSEPSKLLLKFFELNIKKSKAIDLGCGAGSDAIYLLKNGYTVTAVDKEKAIIDIINSKINDVEKTKITFKINCFEGIRLENAELINAYFSIPFCNPEYFDNFWDEISSSIVNNGIFVGNFFGLEDGWIDNKNMTFLDKEKITSLFSNFNILYYDELKYFKNTANNKRKFWHIHELIAQKRL